MGSRTIPYSSSRLRLSPSLPFAAINVIFLPVIKLHTGALKFIPSPCAVIFSYVFVVLVHRKFHSASVTVRRFRQRESISLEIQQK